MNRTNWFSIPHRVLGQLWSKTQTVDVRGVSLQVHVSPYDLPQAMGASYDKNTGILRIEFKYIDDEAAVMDFQDEYLSVFVGVQSKKVLVFEIRVDHGNFDVVELKLIKQLQEMSASSTKTNAKLNYSAVGDLLNQFRDKINLAWA